MNQAQNAQNRQENAKIIEQNQNKLYLGIIEVIYFGFFCFEPRIWPNI